MICISTLILFAQPGNIICIFHEQYQISKSYSMHKLAKFRQICDAKQLVCMIFLKKQWRWKKDMKTIVNEVKRNKYLTTTCIIHGLYEEISYDSVDCNILWYKIKLNHLSPKLIFYWKRIHWTYQQQRRI